MMVHLARHVRVLMWLTLPLTLGIAPLVMWLRLRHYPEQLDEHGIVLRDGRFIRWADIKKVGVLRNRTITGDVRTLRLDLQYGRGASHLRMSRLANSEAVASYIGHMFKRWHPRSDDAQEVGEAVTTSRRDDSDVRGS